MKGSKALIFSLMFGLLAAMATYFYIAQLKKRLFGGFERQPVVVAKQDILMNTPIDSTMLDTRLIPKPFIQPKAVKSPEAVEGYIATANIFAGEQILDTKLARPSERAVSLLVSRDKRAFTIAINEVTGVAGLVRPGDRVDVIGTFQTADKKTRLVSRAESVALLQNVEVLSVGRDYALESVAAAGSGSRSLSANIIPASRKKVRYSNITLSVTPRQAMDLSLAQQLGVLALMLRSYYDRPGKEIPSLKKRRSTPASVTGIEAPLKIGPVPKWLELRGEQAVLVP